ncbi:hypothetical protein DM072_04375, partial [Klebsiella pneumoniae]
MCCSGCTAMKLANCINFTHTGNIMKKYMTYFLRVEGNSMEDARIHDGDVLVVDRALEPEHGSIVIAAVDNEVSDTLDLR